MKKIILLLIITISYHLRSQSIDATRLQIIEPKIGLKNFPIDKTTLSEIIRAFGNNYDKSKDFVLNKSEELPRFYEVKYKSQGISFYFFDNDSTQTIKAVKFYKPFKVKTTTNIILNKSKIGNVVAKNKNSKMIISLSDKYNKVSIDEFRLTTTGISFSSQIPKFNKFPSKKILKKLVIDEIYISNYQYLIFLD